MKNITFFEEDEKELAELNLAEFKKYNPTSRKKIFHLVGTFAKNRIHDQYKFGGYAIATKADKLDEITNIFFIGLIDTKYNKSILNDWFLEKRKEEKRNNYGK